MKCLLVAADCHALTLFSRKFPWGNWRCTWQTCVEIYKIFISVCLLLHIVDETNFSLGSLVTFGRNLKMQKIPYSANYYWILVSLWYLKVYRRYIKYIPNVVKSGYSFYQSKNFYSTRWLYYRDIIVIEKEFSFWSTKPVFYDISQDCRLCGR